MLARTQGDRWSSLLLERADRVEGGASPHQTPLTHYALTLTAIDRFHTRARRGGAWPLSRRERK